MKTSAPSLATIATTLKQEAERHHELAPENPALIGVSGGRDSVCLLHVLHELGWNRLVVCHVNHRLRAAEADADETFVKQVAASLGFACETTRIDVARVAARKKISVELAGRECRDAFFEKMGRKHGTPHVFLAHHLDDQVETVIGNIFRGSGLSGLGGMSATSQMESGMVKVRPLLKWRRAEIESFIRARSLPYRDDSTNAKPDHRRNRIRHEVLPALNDVFQRDVAPIVDRLAGLARRDHECLDEMARDFARFHALFQEDGSLKITPELKSAHPALVSRILWGLLVDVHACPNITHRDVEAGLAMLRPGGMSKINLPGGKHLRRKAGRLWIEESQV